MLVEGGYTYKSTLNIPVARPECTVTNRAATVRERALNELALRTKAADKMAVFL